MRFTEPPSDVGTVGPQVGVPAPLADAAPADEAVVLAAFDDDESGASPGSCSGAWELFDDDAPTEPEEPDRLPVPVVLNPVAVVPFAAAPIVAVLVPADGVDDVEDAAVPGAFDVVLLPGVAVVPLFDADVVVSPEPVVVVPCMFVDEVVCAWSAVAPSSISATGSAMMAVICGIARMRKRVPPTEFWNAGAKLCFMKRSCLVNIGSAAAATRSSDHNRCLVGVVPSRARHPFTDASIAGFVRGPVLVP